MKKFLTSNLSRRKSTILYCIDPFTEVYFNEKLICEVKDAIAEQIEKIDSTLTEVPLTPTTTLKPKGKGETTTTTEAPTTTTTTQKNLDEDETLENELMGMDLDALRGMLKENGVKEEVYRDFVKKELVDLILKS